MRPQVRRNAVKELNNLMGAFAGHKSDIEIYTDYGREIKDYKEFGNGLYSYFRGLVMMSMHDLGYTDGQIDDVWCEIAHHYTDEYEDEKDVLIWEHTHELEV